MFPMNTTKVTHGLSCRFVEPPVTSSSTFDTCSGNIGVKGLRQDVEVTGFDMTCSDLSCRRIHNLASEMPPSVVLNKIGALLTHGNIFAQCKYLKIPFTDISGRTFNFIRSYLCLSNDNETLEKILINLSHDELAFVVIVGEENPSKEFLTFTLFSNDDKSENKRKIRRLYEGDTISGLEFFVISFVFEYSKNGELKVITPARSVHGGYRQNGICTSISLAALELIQQHMGMPNTVLNSATARHIGTVKFYYPLNRFYNKVTGLHLRDTDTTQTTINLSDIEIRDEPLVDFEIIDGIYASCPHDQILLDKLLSQYQARKVLMASSNEST